MGDSTPGDATPGDAQAHSEGPRTPWYLRIEDMALAVILTVMVALPVIEVLGRGRGISSTILVVQHLTLWIGLLGAARAARVGKHIAMAPIADKLEGKKGVIARVIGGVGGGAVALILAVASVKFVLALSPALSDETLTWPMRLRAALTTESTAIGGINQWIWALALPIGYALVALRLGFLRIRGNWTVRGVSLVLVGLVCSVGFLGEDRIYDLLYPGIAVLVIAILMGAPLFALLGGVALLLYAGDGTPIATMPNETFDLVVSPMLPTIPLFTLAGYVLAEGKASERLVRLFRALFGWLPGGLAVAAACVCAFFTTFTGGSGVTILALGGLLLPALIGAGYRERYSLGLLTSSGSLGLLFPPSVPVILYAVVAQTPIAELFAGAFIPGCLLLAAIAATGVFAGVRSGAGRGEFTATEAVASVWEAKWELMLPLVVLGGLFGGYTTPVEASAVTALYAILIETVLNRDLNLRRDLPRVMVNTATLIGGVLMILGVAKGLAYYMVDAQLTEQLAEWVQANVDSKLGFLLGLNVFLLLVGCLMDVFSAIIVVVPIIAPLAVAYGVDPIHLGVIFIANLELGYLTPPVGLNLFLAAIRFERPLLTIYRSTMPFFFILLAVVIAITYIPQLTSWGLILFGPASPG